MTIQYGRICGIGFDETLKQLNLIQQPNESNWQFRKRAFPILWEHLGNEHNSLAMEFLLLLPQDEWSEWEEGRFMELFLSDPSKSDLEKFTKKLWLSQDPVEYRRDHPAKTDQVAEEIILSRV